ncbi:MAG: PPOX class F420-dependent oxidoreductase [bacterium]|nr:PPOX class F420-dependent oxidoreductase [bacterium]
MTALPDVAKALFDAPEFATIATIEPDGRPQLSVVWIERDGDDLLVSTVKGRRKQVNIANDPRVTVLVFAKENPYSYVEVRGTAMMTEAGGRELIDRVCSAYMGWDRYPGDDGTDNVRVVVRIMPEKVILH